MIITNLKGGLGNQLFQYAAGLALATKHRVELKLDTSFLEKGLPAGDFTKRNFELSEFSLEPVIATQQDVERFTLGRKKMLYRIQQKFATWSLQYRYYRHDLSSYDSSFRNLGKETYIDGYFQSEKYFGVAQQKIREAFAIRHPPLGRNAEISAKIQATNSVSLHIRRKDYLSPENQNLFANLWEGNYYQQSVQMIASRTANPFFYIFSDDPEWVRANFICEYQMEFVDFNTGAKSFEDIRLMSQCKHHIIANSSFSWWGAWLNPSSEKMVIAPKAWFRDPATDSNDIIPGSWTRI